METREEKMGEQEAQGQQPAQQEHVFKFNEAPYSGNVRAQIRGYDWQLTIRDDNKESFISRVMGVNKWLDSLKSQPQPQKPQSAPMQVANVAPVAPAQTPAQSVTQSSHQTFQMKVKRLEVTPRADGKVDAKFFQEGHQYPDITAVKTADALCTMLKATGEWKPEHFSAAAQYQINMVIDWAESDKLNKVGKPYKDIVSVKPA